MQEGIYFGMSAAEYHAAPGLSHSGMRDLAVSPLQYWHRHINPARPAEKPTAAQRLGTAIHARVLEPDTFDQRYARKLNKDDYPDALVTIDDLKRWLAERGLPTGHKRKQDILDRVGAAAQERGEVVVLWDELAEWHEQQSQGKELLDQDDWDNVEGAAQAVRADPALDLLLSDGFSEVSLFVRDPHSGVLLKARLDYMTREGTVDLKSFSLGRDRSVEKTISEALYFESYFQQGVFYHDLRALAACKLLAGDIEMYAPHGGVFADRAARDEFFSHASPGFAFVFVESSPPHHLGLRLLHVAQGWTPELYWDEARFRQRQAIERYARCLSRFADAPWREPVRPRILEDQDMPALAFVVHEEPEDVSEAQEALEELEPSQL